MNSPLISIIVPYYNSKKYISKCIESILNQTFKDIELILVDDGSTDSSYSLCESYAQKDHRIVLLQKENGGQGTARNMGLDIAQGSFIGFVDSDDFIDPDMYDIMINYCIKYEADLSICGYKTFRSEKVNPTPLFNEPPKIYNNTELMEAYMATPIISGGPCNKLYRKELFQNLRFPPLRMREDSYLMPHILKKVYKGVYVGENLYNWNINLGSTERSKFTLNNLAAIESLNSLYDVISKNYPDLIYLVKIKGLEVKISLLKKIINTNSYKQNKEVYYKLKNEICEESEILNKYNIKSKAFKYNIFLICKLNCFFIIKELIIGNLKTFAKNIFSKL